MGTTSLQIITEHVLMCPSFGGATAYAMFLPLGFDKHMVLIFHIWGFCIVLLEFGDLHCYLLLHLNQLPCLLLLLLMLTINGWSILHPSEKWVLSGVFHYIEKYLVESIEVALHSWWQVPSKTDHLIHHTCIAYFN